MNHLKTLVLGGFFFTIVFLEGGCQQSLEQSINQGQPLRTIEQWNALGRKEPVRHLVCSGSGALRLVTWLNGAEKVVAIEQIEKTTPGVVPYRMAHPEYQKLPVFGEGQGRDNIEFLLSMNPKPDVIIRIDSPGTGIDPILLQERTNIPVLLIPYGDLEAEREIFNQSIRLLGEVLDKKERAESLLAFIDSQQAELIERTKDIPVNERPTVFLGGMSYRGVHGFNSTAPIYPPFEWLNLHNVASFLEGETIRAQHMMVLKEQIVAWDPDFIFVDLGTITIDNSGGWEDLENQPIYRPLRALQQKKVHALYPNNSYSANFDAMLANAWLIGKIVYPERFSDIDIKKKIEEVFRFMLHDPLIEKYSEDIQQKVNQSSVL